MTYAQTQVSMVMARAILPETAAQKHFDIITDGVADPMAWKYHTLKQDEELAKLNKRLMELDLVLYAAFQMGVPFNLALHSPPIHCVHSPHIHHAHSPNTRINPIEMHDDIVLEEYIIHNDYYDGDHDWEKECEEICNSEKGVRSPHMCKTHKTSVELICSKHTRHSNLK